MGKVEDNRFYKVMNAQGQYLYLKSVTTILDIIDKRWMRYWYAKLGTEAEVISQYALNVGSEAHHLIYDIGNMGHVDPTDWQKSLPEAKVATKAFLNFRSHWKYEPIEQELTVCDFKNMYAGTLDAFGFVTVPQSCPKEMKEHAGDMIAVLIDWKTSKQLSEESSLQLAAYAYAYRHVMPGAMIVRLNKDPLLEKNPNKQYEVKWIPYSRLKELFKTFLHVKAVWEFMNADLVRRVNADPSIIEEEEIGTVS